jgi:hypothetical protein
MSEWLVPRGLEILSIPRQCAQCNLSQLCFFLFELPTSVTSLQLQLVSNIAYRNVQDVEIDF